MTPLTTPTPTPSLVKISLKNAYSFENGAKKSPFSKVSRSCGSGLTLQVRFFIHVPFFLSYFWLVIVINSSFP